MKVVAMYAGAAYILIELANNVAERLKHFLLDHVLLDTLSV